MKTVKQNNCTICGVWIEPSSEPYSVSEIVEVYPQKCKCENQDKKHNRYKMEVISNIEKDGVYTPELIPYVTKML